MNIDEWAARWQIPHQAIEELLMMPLPESAPAENTEAAILGSIRLKASQLGCILWRNNNGATKTEDGRHLRFGLGNDSPRINKEFKSSDLIGVTPVMVTQQHVGKIIGVFTAIEGKHGAWSWSGTEREKAQWKYIMLVRNKGGFAGFATSIEDYQLCLNTTV